MHIICLLVKYDVYKYAEFWRWDAYEKTYMAFTDIITR